jgi:hypothetical protein
MASRFILHLARQEFCDVGSTCRRFDAPGFDILGNRRGFVNNLGPHHLLSFGRPFIIELSSCNCKG